MKLILITAIEITKTKTITIKIREIITIKFIIIIIAKLF